MRKARKERIRTRKRGNEGTKLGEDYRAIQLVECYFRRSQRDSIHTEGDSLLPQRSSRGETGRQRIMFVENRKDDDGRLLNNHRLTSLLFYSERDACIACIHFVKVHR